MLLTDASRGIDRTDSRARRLHGSMMRSREKGMKRGVRGA
jgi:hypothetical protein